MTGRFLALLLILVCSLAGQQAGAERRMSLDLRGVPLTDAVRQVSRDLGVSIVLERGAGGKVTLFLTDVLVDEGLAALAAAGGVELSVEGGVYRLRPPPTEGLMEVNVSRGRLTAEFAGADVRQAVALLSERCGLSIVPDRGLAGRLSGSVNNVVPEDGVRMLLEGAGYLVDQRRGIMQVALRDSASAAGGTYVPRPEDAQLPSYSGSRYDRKGDAVREAPASAPRRASRGGVSQEAPEEPSRTRASLANRPTKAAAQPADDAVLPAMTPGQAGRKGGRTVEDTISRK